jgi:hypothetical protein
MTISSTLRRAGPFTGNSVSTTFPFAFKIFDKTNVEVVRTDSNLLGAETVLVLDSDYSVALNADQNANPGGTITYPISGTGLLSSTQQLTTIGSLAYLQPTDLTNTGGFYPKTIEDALDREVILSQQLQEIVSRAIVLPITEQNPPELPPAAQRANTLFGFDALGNLELMPITATVGAGSLTPEILVNGVNFTAGVSNSVTLGKAYGSKANLGTVVMAGIAQSPDTYDLNGVTLTFNATIPLGVDKIWCLGGTTLSIYLPPDRSVGPQQIMPNSIGAGQIVAHGIGDGSLTWQGILNRVCSSVAEMAGLDPAVYLRAFTICYANIGDGGGGAYFYNPSIPHTSANGGTIIASTVGVGCWYLQHDGTVNVSQFGAKGSSVPGALVDDTAAFRAAVATGLTVHINRPLTYWRLTNSITLTFAGQVIYGDGMDVSIVQVDTSFNMSALGVFIFATPSPWGPVLRNFKITFVQPDVAVLASLTSYPVAVYAQNQPRFKLLGMQITQAMTLLDMTGNSGGCVIDGCQFSAYVNHVLIDGAQDSVKISNTHMWPYDMTANQTIIHTAAACYGIRTNRCDDLSVSNCLIYCGTKIAAGQGGTGPTFGKVSNTSLDNGNGVVMSAGTLSFAGCYFSVGSGSPQWVNISGTASARFTACDFSVGVAGTQVLLAISGSAAALAIFTGCTFTTGGSDQTMVTGVGVGGGNNALNFVGCYFSRTPGANWTNPTITISAGCRLTMNGCRNLDKGGGSGTHLVVGVDDRHNITGNTFTGWTISLPGGYVTLVYANNN